MVNAAASGWDVVLTHSYQHSAIDQVVAAEGGTISFAYDSFDQLLERITRQVREVFRYDVTGNVVPANTNAAIGPGDRLLSFGEWALEWDELGRLTRKSKVVDGHELAWRYAWHGSGALLEVIDPAGRSCRFECDAFGRRRPRGSSRSTESSRTAGKNGIFLPPDEKEAKKAGAPQTIHRGNHKGPRAADAPEVHREDEEEDREDR